MALARRFCAIMAVICLLTAGGAAFARDLNPYGLGEMEDESPTADQKLHEIFGQLEIFGSTYNSSGGSQALRTSLQAGCGRAADHIVTRDVVSKLLDGQDIIIPGDGIRSSLFDKAIGAARSALNSGCSAFSGQSSGDGDMFGSLLGGVKQDAFLALVNKSEQLAHESGLPFLGRLEIETGTSDGAFVSSVTTLQPLWHSKDSFHHIFTQLSWYKTDREHFVDTMNAGLVYRMLNESKTVLYGINMFLDHAPELNHNRMSIGADIQTSLMGASLNRYIPLSNYKSRDLYMEERPAAGWDLELRGQTADLPSWTAAIKGYQWDCDEGDSDLYGYTAMLEYSPFPALAVRGGVRDESEGGLSSEFAMRFNLRYDQPLDLQFKPRLQLASVEDRVYQKVSRENTIRVKERRKASAYLNVLQTIGANSAQGPEGLLGLAAGLNVPMPSTIFVANTVGAIARLSFLDGALLTLGQDTRVFVEADKITLLSGVATYTSGGVSRVVNVPGGVIELLGTDIDMRTNGVLSTVRVRDGAIRLTGTVSGSTTLQAGGMAGATNGNVATVAGGTATYEAHADDVSTKIDRLAIVLVNDKTAAYPVQGARIVQLAGGLGTTLRLGVKFSQAVTVSGGPARLNATINGNVRQLVLSSGSSTDNLIFDYTFVAADVGASAVTVTGFDQNGATITGANGKPATTTMADTTLSLTGIGGDVTAPSGYAVAFTTTPLTSANQSAAAFQITGAEVGAVYNYSIASSGGGTALTGTGTIATATQSISAINTSTLADGTLTVSLTLTDAANNTGVIATGTVIKSANPSMSMDFINNVYTLAGTTYNSVTSFLTAAGGTFTRATTATYFNSSGVLQTASAGTVRFDHDPSNGSPRGVLLEATRTNYIQNSQFSGITTGTYTTTTDINHWRVNFTAGMTSPSLEIVSTGTSNGIPYLDMRIQAANSSGSSKWINFQMPTADNFAVTAGQVTILSAWLGVSSYSSVGGTCEIVLSNRSVGVNESNIILTAVTAYSRRVTPTITQANGTAAGWLYFHIPNGATCDTTVRFGAPQIEIGAIPSSYIPTTSGTATRNADVLTFPTGAWFNTAAGTMASEAAIPYVGGTSYPGPLAIDDGTLNNSISIFVADATTDTKSYDVFSGNVGIASGSAGTYTAGNVVKQAVAWELNNTIGAMDNTLTTLDTGFTTPTVNTVRVGGGRGGFNPLFGWVRNLKYYTARLPSAEVQALTQ